MTILENNMVDDSVL